MKIHNIWKTRPKSKSKYSKKLNIYLIKNLVKKISGIKPRQEKKKYKTNNTIIRRREPSSVNNIDKIRIK